MAESRDFKGRLLKTGESQRSDGRYRFRFKPKGSQTYKVIYSHYFTVQQVMHVVQIKNV